MEDMNKKYIVICDIDNCFTDSREWIKHAPHVDARDKSVARDMWDKYQNLSFLAKPNKSVIDFVRTIAELTPIYLLREKTEEIHVRTQKCKLRNFRKVL